MGRVVSTQSTFFFFFFFFLAMHPSLLGKGTCKRTFIAHPGRGASIGHQSVSTLEGDGGSDRSVWVGEILPETGDPEVAFEPGAALYALDDLHRLDLILRTQRPPSGSYTEARNQTDNFVCRL